MGNLNNKEIEQNIADAIMERPYCFSVGNRNYYLYPTTLGKSYLLSRLMECIDISPEEVKVNPFAEAMRVCKEKKDIVCRFIAYHTFNIKTDLQNEYKVEARQKFFMKEISTKDLAQLFVITITNNPINTFISFFGIDKEREMLAKCHKAKDTQGSYTFGGKSIYGSMIDVACQRYGWTFDYVVWGISYINLQMLLSDTVTTVYLNDKERKKVHIPTDRTFISGDDPANQAILKAMEWN